MIEAGYQFALGVFLFILTLLGLYFGVKKLIDNPVARKLDALCRRYPWQMGIATALMIVALVIWRVATFRVVH